MTIPVKLMLCLGAPALAAGQIGNLGGYVFREADGGPPRRSLTVELASQGKTKHRVATRPDGTFNFDKVREGRYTLRARFNEFIAVEEMVEVTDTGENFAAVMLPKRRAGAQTFGTVTVGRLAAQSDRGLQKKLREAAKLAAKADYSGAAQLYEEALAAGAQPEAWDALGLLYLYMGERDKAYQALQKAIEQDAKYLLAYAHLGSAYLEQRKYKELTAVASRGLAVDAAWLTGHIYLAEAQAAEGNLEAALRSAETASQVAQGRAPGPYLVLAKIYWARRDCASARRHLERHLALNTTARALPEIAKSLELVNTCRF